MPSMRTLLPGGITFGSTAIVWFSRALCSPSQGFAIVLPHSSSPA
ncbi:hypothetical protein [Clostridium phage Maintenon]|nr:hypothetical protein [Clostridium phage Maintenon]